MLLNFYLYYRNVLLGFHCKRQLRSTMSGSTEPSQLLMAVKNIKEEESDHFLQEEYLFEIQTVEEKPELEHDCKTETHTSPTLTCKEEHFSLMEIKEEPDLRGCGDDDSSTSKNSWLSRIQIKLITMFRLHLLNTEWLTNGFTCALLSTICSLFHCEYRYYGNTSIMGHYLQSVSL